MKLLNFSIIQLTIFLIFGILIGNYIESSQALFNIIAGLLVLSICILYFLKKIHKTSSLFFMLACLAMLLTGVFNVIIHDVTLNTRHYLNTSFKANAQNEIYFKIKKRLKPNSYNEKYVVELLQLNSKPLTGQLLLNLEKDSLLNTISIDDIFLVTSQISEIQKPKNPYQFDYNAYLKQRHIYHQFYTNPKSLLQINANSTSLYGFADNIRKTINEKLIATGFKGDVLAIINALLLGQRQDISPETYANYTNSGTIHILAVSGLHVGIVFLILSYVLKPVERLTYGKSYIKPFLILLFLWAFAVIAGLSPSVTRAVTMFSIVAIAQHLNRPTNIYNTLAISAFIILLLEPNYIFEIGFQMSYLAVFAIVSIQPLLYKLWQPKYYLIDKPWQIFTVTVAAQLGVAPISLFYFHQFPGLFFVSNLVVIPFLGIILGFGLLIISLAVFDVLPRFMSDSFSFIIETLNQFIAWVAQFENFLLKDISFNGLQVVSAYLIISSFILLWIHKSFTYVRLSLMSLIIFLLVSVYTKYMHSDYEFIVFNSSRQTLIGEKTGNTLLIYHDNDTLNTYQKNTIKNYRVGHFIKTIQIDNLEPVFKINDKTLLIVDSLSVYNVKSFKPDYILLSKSPQLNLSRLIDSLKPQQIIADANNYKSYVARWNATCKVKKVPFHSTYEKGAIILK